MAEDEYDSDDSEIVMKPAFYVEELPANFDPHQIPQNGEEYLHHVMHERRHCKSLIVAEKLNNSIRNTVSEVQRHEEDLVIGLPVPEHFLPSLVWQETKLKEYLKLHKFLEMVAEEYPPDSIPKLSFQNAIIQEKIKPSYHQVPRHLPTILQFISEATNHLKGLPKGSHIEENLAAWLYALLVVLAAWTDFLNGGGYAVLVEFCKKCRELRQHLPHNIEEVHLKTLNLMILIVARHFQQYNLADPM